MHTEDRIHDVLIFLASAPRHAWMIDTETLEQVLARAPGLTHGRKDADAVLVMIEHLAREVAAVLQARRALDAIERQAADTPADFATQGGAQGGARVKRPGPGPGPLPPARISDRELAAEREALAIEAGAL